MNLIFKHVSENFRYLSKMQKTDSSLLITNNSDLSINPDIQKWFNAVDTDNSGRIISRELQSALIDGQGKSFSENACSLMISLFDKNKKGSIDLNEFQHLYTYVNQWVDAFRAYDKNNSGFIEEEELLHAVQQMGYRFTRNFLKIVIENTADNDNGMSLDRFIVTCVKIQRLTDAFSLRDKDRNGVISLDFDDFLCIALNDFL